jgi:hypothetical protein
VTDFRYYIKLYKSDFVTDSWETLKTPELPNLAVANEWALQIANQQADLYRHMSRRPTPEESIDSSSGMHSYRIDLLNRHWIVAVDRQPTEMTSCAFEVLETLVDISVVPADQLGTNLRHTPRSGVLIRRFHSVKDANEYACIHFFGKVIKSESDKRVGGLSLSDFHYFMDHREAWWREATAGGQYLHVFGSLNPYIALVCWVQPVFINIPS